MSWWQRAIRWMSAENLTAKDEGLYEALGGGSTHTDEVVNSSSVMGLSTASACIGLISGTISSLSADVYRKNESRLKVLAGDHQLQGVLDDPNGDQSPIDFWEQMSLGLELWGNAYAVIERHRDGINALVPVRPDIMRVERTSSGALKYTWYDDRRHEEPEDRVFHIRGFGGDPLGGLSPLSYARNTFGTAQAIERAAGRTFVNGVRPSIALESDKLFSSEQRKEAEDRLATKYQGAMNAGRPMLFDNGLKVKQISFNPEDAQMLQSRGFSVEEVCRVYGVPPFMVGHTEKVTSFGSGLEQQILGFQKFTLRKRLKKIEQAIRKQLMSPEDQRAGYSVSFNLEDLLRADTKARSDFYKAMLETKVFVINEVRALEGKEPVPWGNEPWGQMQDKQLGDDAEAAGDKEGEE